MQDQYLMSGQPSMQGTASPSIQGPAVPERNGAGIELPKLKLARGRKKGSKFPNVRHPSSLAKAFKRIGLNWQEDFGQAIKKNDRRRIALWLKLLPFMQTKTGALSTKKFKGRASKAAVEALDILEGR